MVSIRWYLGCLQGQLGGAGRDLEPLDWDLEHLERAVVFL